MNNTPAYQPERTRQRRWPRRLLLLFLLLFILSAVGAYFYPPLRQGPRFIGLLLESAPEQLPVPVKGVTPSQLADTWGAARSGGRTHKGIDIFAPRNRPVLSTTHGIVYRVGENKLGGRRINILGPGGYHHYYAHLERYGPQKEGDWVEAGEVIGYVGNSGNARTTPTHLHYGIYTPGFSAINPFPLLRK